MFATLVSEALILRRWADSQQTVVVRRNYDNCITTTVFAVLVSGQIAWWVGVTIPRC